MITPDGHLSRIHSLLNPESVAVIGASNSKGKVGNIIFEGLRRCNARLYPVNQYEDVISGHKTYPQIADLPDTVDVAVITVRADQAVEITEQCGRKGVKNIIIVAGGFAETGDRGKALEARLKAIPRRYESRILEPNSLGVFVPENSFDTIFWSTATELWQKEPGSPLSARAVRWAWRLWAWPAIPAFRCGPSWAWGIRST